MTDTRRGPAALLVMEEERRADVYPTHVLDEIGELAHWQGPALTRDALGRDPGVLEGVEVLLTGWGAPVLDADLLAHAPELKAVLVAAGSVRHLTTPEFWARGIPIVSAAAANARPVAEFTLGQILLGLKQVHRLGREAAAARRYPRDPRVAGGTAPGWGCSAWARSAGWSRSTCGASTSRCWPATRWWNRPSHGGGASG